MSEVPPFVRVVQTSIACPAQWDAWDADGKYYYLRFRHGHGSIERYEKEGVFFDEDCNRLGKLVADFGYGDEWAGHISLAEFLELAGGSLTEGSDTKNFGTYLAEAMAEVVAELTQETEGPDVTL